MEHHSYVGMYCHDMEVCRTLTLTLMKASPAGSPLEHSCDNDNHNASQATHRDEVGRCLFSILLCMYIMWLAIKMLRGQAFNRELLSQWLLPEIKVAAADGRSPIRVASLGAGGCAKGMVNIAVHGST